MLAILSPTTWVNLLLRKTGVLDSPAVYNRNELDKYSPQKRQKLLDAYQASLSIDINKINQQNHFNEYVNKYKTEGGTDLTSNLVVKEIQADLEDLDKCISQIGARFHPDDIKLYMQNEQKFTIDEIKKLHADELNKATGDKTALKATQDKLLKELEESFNKDLETMHKAAQLERDRVAILATFREYDSSTRKEINKQNTAATPRATGSVTIAPGDILKDVKLENLTKPIKTPSGSDMQYNKDANILSIKFRKPFFFPWAWFRVSDTRDPIKEDMLIFAQTCKALGKESIDFKLVDADSDYLKIVAKKAFEAFLEAGYPEDKIKISIKGVPVNIKDAAKDEKSAPLFKDGLAAAKQQADITEKARNEFKKSQKEVKEIMDLHRRKRQPVVAPEASPTSGPTTMTGGPAADPASTIVSGASAGRR